MLLESPSLSYVTLSAGFCKLIASSSGQKAFASMKIGVIYCSFVGTVRT